MPSSRRPDTSERVIATGGLYVLFFLSGISALIYESLWSRYLRLFLGSAATAQILVLSLLMGGMALGALVAGRTVTRLRAPIAVYGVLEGAIGLYALVFPYLMEGVMSTSYEVIFPALGSGLGADVSKWVLASIVLLPPCVALGMTFPVMSVGVLRRKTARSGEILSLLYFTNSLGGAVGALLPGLALVGVLGLHGSLAVAASLNLAIMIIATRERESLPPLAKAPAVVEVRAPSAGLAMLLVVAFGTGLASFLYEIGWIRLLSMVLGSATRSFEIMLSAFVLGIALGGLWVRKRVDRFKHPLLVLAIVQLAMGMAAVATIPFYRVAVAGIVEVVLPEERTIALWFGFNAMRYAVCLLVMLPATFCAGMTLPLITHALLRWGRSEGVVGTVYGVNTLGAIAGAVAGGLILLPLLGLKRVIVLGALVDMVLGVWLVARYLQHAGGEESRWRLILRPVVLAVVVCGLGLSFVRLDPMVLNSGAFRHGHGELHPRFRVVSHADGRTATIALTRDATHPGFHTLYTNGKPDASVILDHWPSARDPSEGPDMAADEQTQLLIGLVPLTLRPGAQSAAVIGLGSGVTSHTLLGSANLRHLDTIEIEPEMVAAAAVLEPVNRRAFADPRSHIHIDDAKVFFARERRTYDIIVSEPSNPWVSGVASLFSVEFYGQVSRYLAGGGVFVQWIQGYELSDERMINVLAAFDRVFVDYDVYKVGDGDWMIVGVKRGAVGRPKTTPLSWTGLDEAWSLLGIRDIGQVDALHTAPRALLHPFLAQQVANTDARPVLEAWAERDRFLRLHTEVLDELRQLPAAIVETLGAIERRPYPRAGLPDYRKPGVHRGAEVAAALQRLEEDPELEHSPWLEVIELYRWHNRNKAARGGYGDWPEWAASTFAIYQDLSPYGPVVGTLWWDRVLRTAARPHAPVEARDAIELIDQLERRRGAELRLTVERVLERGDDLLPRGYVVMAGGVALVLDDASPAERRAFVDAHLAPRDDGQTSADLALRIVLARVADG